MSTNSVKKSPNKVRRSIERDTTFAFKRLFSEIEHKFQSKIMSKLSCGAFDYAGDATTIGARWTSWQERFGLYVSANGLDDATIIKSSFLLLMGPQAFEVYKTKKKVDNTDTLDEIKVFMNTHFVAKKSEYTEVVAFRNAFRLEGELVSDYAMRLRHIPTHCKYGTSLEKEIERQFVVGC